MDASKPLLIVLSAPSGGGKTSLCDHLLARHSEITRAVTCTTRPPRPGEVNGVHYCFLSRQEFLTKVSSGDFLEHASVYDNLYGTLRKEVLSKLDSGRHVLLNIDVQGAASVRQLASLDSRLASRMVSVFLTPPSLAELKRRLNKRGSESSEALAVRLDKASLEVSEWKHFDYLILSSSIEEDVRKMKIIIDAELMRKNRVEPPTL